MNGDPEYDENAAAKAMPSTPARPEPAVTPRIDSATLLGRAGELIIEHCGRNYRLRVTQNGKLILTA